MVDDLVQCIIFIRDGGVVYVDKSVGAAREQEVRLGRVILDLPVGVIGDRQAALGRDILR